MENSSERTLAKYYGKRLNLLHLSKIGGIPVRVHRAIDGKIKQVIKRHNSGKWFVCICVGKEAKVIRSDLKEAIGIDVG